jgi:hypothetical protein
MFKLILEITYSEWQIRNQIEQIRKDTGIEFSQKSFQKNFAHRMEMAGASADVINLHQGRSQSSVLVENY